MQCARLVSCTDTREGTRSVNAVQLQIVILSVGGGCFTNQHTSATLRRFCTAPTPTPRAARWQLRGLLHV